MSQEFSIAPLREEHLPALAELERACFADPWSEESLAILTEERGFGAVVMLDGRAVAYGGMTFVLDEGSITNIATLPEFRGRGFGHAVVGALLSEAKARGITAVFLEVRPSNLPALALYRAEGFTVCGVRKSFYRHPTEDALQMVWRTEETEETEETAETAEKEQQA